MGLKVHEFEECIEASLAGQCAVCGFVRPSAWHGVVEDDPNVGIITLLRSDADVGSSSAMQRSGYGGTMIENSYSLECPCGAIEQGNASLLVDRRACIATFWAAHAQCIANSWHEPAEPQVSGREVGWAQQESKFLGHRLIVNDIPCYLKHRFATVGDMCTLAGLNPDVEWKIRWSSNFGHGELTGDTQLDLGRHPNATVNVSAI